MPPSFFEYTSIVNGARTFLDMSDSRFHFPQSSPRRTKAYSIPIERIECFGSMHKNTVFFLRRGYFIDESKISACLSIDSDFFLSERSHEGEYMNFLPKNSFVHTLEECNAFIFLRLLRPKLDRHSFCLREYIRIYITK